MLHEQPIFRLPLKWGDTTVLQAVTVKNSHVLTVDGYILGLFTIGGELFGMTKHNEKLWGQMKLLFGRWRI